MSMRHSLRAVVLLAAALSVPALAREAPSSRPLAYITDCEGCHKADGSGQPGIVPEFRDHIASYLSTAAGREYLIRVPGVAQSALSDQDVADVINWMLKTYDPDGLPAGFLPFTAAEVGTLRQSPLSDATRERSRVLALAEVASGDSTLSDAQASGVFPRGEEVRPAREVEQPAAFAVCAACHPVSEDGANGMGPNLRGVFGRKSGVNPDFEYSGSMKAAGIVWTESNLDAFVQSPRKVVSNTSMTFMGEPDAGRRGQIVHYLKSLR